MDNNKQQFISTLKKAYLDRIKFYDVDGADLSRFTWSENKTVNLHIYKTYNDQFPYMQGFMILFATPSKNKNKVTYADFTNQTHTPDFSRYLELKDMISWLIDKQLIPKEKIYPNSISMCFGKFQSGWFTAISDNWAKSWVDNEYKDTNKLLSLSNQVAPLPVTNQKFFIDRYHFDEMLSSINDKQFEDEFNQCLWAYEHNKWFICAAGLGTCLEHLMEAILLNYTRNGTNLIKALGKAPTMNDYIRAFRQPPINLEPRQETYLKMLAMGRNSIDHHHKGYTSKNICDELLDGIRNTFNDYYTQSINYTAD